MSDQNEIIAVVTGASRSIGLGVAQELGSIGATVIISGRSRSGKATTDNMSKNCLTFKKGLVCFINFLAS